MAGARRLKGVERYDNTQSALSNSKRRVKGSNKLGRKKKRKRKKSLHFNGFLYGSIVRAPLRDWTRASPNL